MPDLQTVFEACVASYRQATFTASGVEVLHVRDGDSDILAFRGTEGARDAIKDMRSLPWSSHVGMVHSGFYKGVMAVWQQLLPVVFSGRPVTYAGHSKGGAEATIAAAMAVHARQMPAHLVTFGAPRCGFSEMVRKLKPVPIRRYVNGHDAVTSHPWPLWGYRHPCNPVNIGESQGRYDDHALESGYGVGLGFRQKKG